MFLGNKIVYLELHKTGCSRVIELIKGFPQIEGAFTKKHDSFSDLTNNQKEIFNSAVKIGNVRNPWDWYVSLWAYGCQKNGRLYNATAGLKLKDILFSPGDLLRQRHEWKKAYSDVQNPENFKLWLRLLFDNSPASRYNKESFHISGASAHIGLFSLRFMRLYSKSFNSQLKILTSFSLFKDYFDNQLFIDHYIKNESLEEDFVLAMNSEGYNIDISSSQSLQKKERINYSKHLPYFEYYDADLKALVHEKEKLIIDKFNYQFK